MGYPFTHHVKQLNQDGKRFYDMQRECNEARSAAWWNKVANEEWVGPPPRDRLDDIAAMMGLPKRRVQEMIAEEWYEVSPEDGISDRVRNLAPGIDELNESDAEYIKLLIDRLRPRSEEPAEQSSAAG